MNYLPCMYTPQKKFSVVFYIIGKPGLSALQCTNKEEERLDPNLFGGLYGTI